MNEESKHSLNNQDSLQQESQFVKYPDKEESQYVVPCEKNPICKEMGKLGPLFAAAKTPPKSPSWSQREKAWNNLITQIQNSRCDIITTLKDKLTATDSLLVRLLFYLALISALAILAASAFIVYQALTLEPAEAAALFSSFAALA
jgi:hypothetical protein